MVSASLEPSLLTLTVCSCLYDRQLACLKEGSETGISCSTRAVLDRRRTAGENTWRCGWG